ncbi:MAG: iron-containing alcohol dehydrogenase [Balneola sp.]
MKNIFVGDIDKIITEVTGKVVLITSPSVQKIKSVKAVISVLKNTSKVSKLSIFNISPDAPLNELETIVTQTEKPDVLIAIGGGSVIDSAKALSLCWHSSSVFDLFYKRSEIPYQKIKLIVAPTTFGTGAELSHGAILYDKEKQIKSGIRSPFLQPDKVIIDYKLNLSAPPKLKAETGFDCLTHAIETYCSNLSNGLAKYQSVKAIDTVLKNLPKAVNLVEESIEQMAFASAMMGINLATSSTCLPHRIQYIIGPETNTSHAQGLIMLYRGWIPKISKEPVFQELANDLGISKSVLVSSISDLKKELSIDYKLSDFNFEVDRVTYLSESVTGNVNADPSYTSIETIKEIIEDSI